MMDTAITYTNHLGGSLTFGGSEEALNYLAHTLRDYKWSYTVRGGKVTRFTMDPKAATFPVGIAASSEEDGLAWRDRIHALVAPDRAARTPGSLEICGYRASCYVIGAAPTNYWMDGRFAEIALTVLFTNGFWTREVLHHFTPKASVGFGSGIDFPFEFPFDFAATRPPQVITNTATGSGPFIWRVFGPARDPYFMAGGDKHQVFVELKNGERLEVDSRPGARTAIKMSAAGEATNVFDKRLRGSSGSGTYLFEPIPAGRVEFSWDNGYAFDLILVDQTDTPPWVAPEGI